MCAAVGRPIDGDTPGYRVMAERCAACTKGDDCLLWRIEATDASRGAPGYCLNAEAIAALAPA